MKVTKKSVIIETTSMIDDCLVQGGICGRVEAYPLTEVMRVTGMTAEDLEFADEWDECPGYIVSIRELIEHRLTPRVLRRGVVIQ